MSDYLRDKLSSALSSAALVSTPDSHTQSFSLQPEHERDARRRAFAREQALLRLTHY